MAVLRRAGQWLAWGGLGPILLLCAYVTLDESLVIYQVYPWALLEPVFLAQAVAGVVTAAAGILFIVRPIAWWWAPVIVAIVAALNITSEIALDGLQADELLWVAIFLLLGFYAYHCHVPGYTLLALKDALRRAPSGDTMLGGGFGK